MIYYIIATLIALAGLIHYWLIEPLVIKAFRNKKIFRVLFLILIHGPFAWLSVVGKYGPLFSMMVTMYFLQEVAIEEPDKVTPPNITQMPVKEKTNDQSDN